MPSFTSRLWNRLTRSLRTRHPESRKPRLTTLEDRLAPATLYGLTNSGNQLFIFDSATPNTVTTLNVTGLGGEKLLNLDFRPADLKLYAVSDANFKLYSIDITTGAATPIGAAGVGTLSTSYGFDFNPVVDRIRFVGDMGNNLRLNPNDGSLVMIDGGISGAATGLVGAAYTNSFAGTTSTALYGIDAANDNLVLVTSPNGGTTTLVGSLGVDTSNAVGFDIAFADGVAYATLTVGGVNQLYTIDLATGAATLVGNVGMGTVPLIGLSAKYTTNTPPIVTLSGGSGQYDIQTDIPALVDPSATIKDLDSADFGGGALTVTLAGGVAGDVLDIQNQGTGAGQVNVSAGKVFIGATEIGSYIPGTDIVPLIVAFNAGVSIADAQTVLRAVTFATTDDSLMPATRTFSASVDDGDGGTGNSNNRTMNLGDFTPPTVVSVTRVGTSPTNASMVDFTVTFSEDVTGVDLTDFLVAGTNTAVGNVMAVTMVDGKTYTVTVDGVTGNGNLQLNVTDDDSISDAAGNKLGGTGAGNGDFTTGEAYVIDTVDPIGIITLDFGQADPAFSQPVVFLVSFSEEVVGFDSMDIKIAGTAPGTLVATVTQKMGDPLTYFISVDGATGSGTVVVSFEAGAATDLAGNPVEASIHFDNVITLDLDNDPPVVTAPTDIKGTEDVEVTFTGANTISIADPDLNGNELKVTLTATLGTLTFFDTTGLTFSDGDGTDDVTMTFTGTEAAVNAALLTLFFTPTTDANGMATVTIDADDQGFTGFGGAKVGSATINIELEAVNDAPTVTITGGPFNTDEDTTFNFPTGSIVFADVDAGTDLVEISISVTNGTLTIADFSKLTFSLGDGTDDTAMVFQGTLADINAAMNGLSFTPTLNSTANAVLSAEIDDLGHNGTGGMKSAADSETITINAINDAPVITAPATITFDEDKTFTFTGANAITVDDVDAGTSPIKITLATTNGTLTLSTVAGLTFTTGDGTGDVSMAFSGTLAAINAALNNSVLTPVANFNGAATVSITADDQGATGAGGAKTDAADIDVTVNAVNDLPVAVNDSFTTLQNLPITISAPGVLANDTDGDGTPLTAVLVTGVPAKSGTLTLNADGGFNFVPAPNFVGVVTFTYQASDGSGVSNVATVTITVNERFTRLFATGAGAGGTPHVVVRNEDGSVRFSFSAFDPAFGGGVAVATGDVNGDGVEDIVVGAGAGGGPHVRVLSGVDLGQIHSFYAFDQSFTGGVNVSTADVNDDGQADIIVGAGAGGGPHVRVFDGKTGAVIQDFFAYSPEFRGGVNVAGGDYNGDGLADIITGAGPGGAPHVIVYAGGSGQILKSFYAFDEQFAGGVTVAAGEFNNEAAIFTGAGSGGVPVVNIFAFDTATPLSSFFAFDASVTSGVRIATEIQSDGSTVLFLAPGIGQPPATRAVDPDTLIDVTSFFAYDPAFLGGVFIG